MTQWILSSSVLIVCIVALRRLLRGRITQRVQYALWGLVLVRLLVPVQFGSSAISVNNVTQESEFLITQETILPTVTVDTPTAELIPTLEPTVPVETTPQLPSMETIITALWIGGSIVVGLWFGYTNVRFGRMLKRNRVLLEDHSTKLPVYMVDGLTTPCLFGSAIYVTSATVDNPQQLAHVLAHEGNHRRHGDHIWSLLRCLCLVVHWYNPLVWCAAVLSSRDCELACDEATMEGFAIADRMAYGRTLLEMTCAQTPSLLMTASTMVGGKKTLKERIGRIANKPNMAQYTVIGLSVVVMCVIGFTFTGAEAKDIAIIGGADGPTAVFETEIVGAEPVEIVPTSVSSSPTLSNWDTLAIWDMVNLQILGTEPTGTVDMADTIVVCTDLAEPIIVDSHFSVVGTADIPLLYSLGNQNYETLNLQFNALENNFSLTDSMPADTSQLPESPFMTYNHLVYYLLAIQYLPQEEIAALAGDGVLKYAISFESPTMYPDGTTLHYNQDGLTEKDGWQICIEVQPVYETGVNQEDIIYAFFSMNGEPIASERDEVEIEDADPIQDPTTQESDVSSMSTHLSGLVAADVRYQVQKQYESDATVLYTDPDKAAAYVERQMAAYDLNLANRIPSSDSLSNQLYHGINGNMEHWFTAYPQGDTTLGAFWIQNVSTDPLPAGAYISVAIYDSAWQLVSLSSHVKSTTSIPLMVDTIPYSDQGAFIEVMAYSGEQHLLWSGILQSSDQATYPAEGTTSAGKTYGYLSHLWADTMPDLIAVMGENGNAGYIESQYSRLTVTAGQTLPVYNLDGVAVDTFTIAPIVVENATENHWQTVETILKG